MFSRRLGKIMESVRFEVFTCSTKYKRKTQEYYILPNRLLGTVPGCGGTGNEASIEEEEPYFHTKVFPS